MKNEPHMPWYIISNTSDLYTPSLVIYPDRVKENIKRLIKMAGDTSRLRPHIKTCKSPSAIQLMQDAGISKYKCATIAEAEMLGNCGAKDVLLAYQPVGPNIKRFITLIKTFSGTHFSCLVDDPLIAKALNDEAVQAGIKISIYIDLNVGMNRTGIATDKALSLCKACAALAHLDLLGLHVYDGHIHDESLLEREKKCEAYYGALEALRDAASATLSIPLKIIAGGTPTFPFHLKYEQVECSPGTFIFWDRGYQLHFKEQSFLPAALVLARVISIIDHQKIGLDLGHKAIAAENDLAKRVIFLNAPEAIPVSQSEEHLVLQVEDSGIYQLGDLFYGLPYHICPTVALYDTATAIVNHQSTQNWLITARKRFLSI